jgi:dolichol-phosphate mannosyltransferase
MIPELSIVIPVYNEGENIEKLFNEINEKITKIKKEVLIIYDFKEDNTIPVVENLKGNYDFDIKLVHNTYGKGVINAIKTGFENSQASTLLVSMADLSDDLIVVEKMFELIKDGYDIVCGSRYMKNGKQIGGPFLKSLLSRIAGTSLHYLTGMPTHDVTNSFKMYRKEIINKIKIESTGGFEIGMEITIKSFVNGYKITEVPSTWTDREKGTSKFKMWRWIPKYLKWYFYAIKNKRY